MAVKANVNISLSRLAEILAAPFQGGSGGEVEGGGGGEYGGAPGREMTPAQQQTYDFRAATNPSEIAKAQSAADLERTKALVARMDFYEKAYQRGASPDTMPEDYRAEYVAYARDKGAQDNRLNQEMLNNPLYIQQRNLGILPSIQGRPNTGTVPPASTQQEALQQLAALHSRNLLPSGWESQVDKSTREAVKFMSKSIAELDAFTSKTTGLPKYSVPFAIMSGSPIANQMAVLKQSKDYRDEIIKVRQHAEERADKKQAFDIFNTTQQQDRKWMLQQQAQQQEQQRALEATGRNFFEDIGKIAKPTDEGFDPARVGVDIMALRRAYPSPQDQAVLDALERTLSGQPNPNTEAMPGTQPPGTTPATVNSEDPIGWWDWLMKRGRYDPSFGRDDQKKTEDQEEDYSTILGD